MACNVTWNPEDKHADYTLSNQNLTATKTALGNGILRATHSKETDKRYFEIFVNTRSTNIRLGIATAACPLSSRMGMSPWAWCLYYNLNKYHDSQSDPTDLFFTTNDTFQCAIDLSLGKVWFGINNTYASGGNPAAGTGETYQDADLMNYPIFPTGGAYNSGNVFTIRACDTDHVYSPPSGFVSWLVTPSAKLIGTVKEKGVAVIRTLRCYTRSTGVLFDTTVSEADGSFILDAPDDATEMIVIAFDNDLGDQYNALIYDRVIGIIV